MAAYTSNYGWTKPSGSDNVDINVLNNNLDNQDSTIHDAFLNMAPPFSESSTYAVDDIVLYGTGIFKCHTAVITPGSWTGSTNWQVYKLSEGGSGGGSGEIKNLDNGMLSHSTDSSYITVNLDVPLTAGKEYKITIRDAQYNYVDTKQIIWTSDVDVVFPGVGSSGSYGIRLTQTTVSLYNYGGTGWRDIYCDIVSDFSSENYNDFTNKPSINGVELSGNKTAAQLGLMASDGVVANPTGQTTETLTALEVGGTKYAVGGGGGPEIVTVTTTLGTGASPSEIKICDYPVGFNESNTMILGAISETTHGYSLPWNGMSQYSAIWFMLLRSDGIYGIWNNTDLNGALTKITLLKLQ